MDDFQPATSKDPPAGAAPAPPPETSPHRRKRAYRIFWHAAVVVVEEALRFARTVPGVISIVLVAVTLYATVRVWPHYLDRYALEDAMVAVARAPRGTDEQLLNRLLAAVQERQMQKYVSPDDFQITTLDGHRRVSCAYQAPVFFIPEREARLHFRIQVEEPFVETSLLELIHGR